MVGGHAMRREKIPADSHGMGPDRFPVIWSGLGADWVRFPMSENTRHDSRQLTVVVHAGDDTVSDNEGGSGWYAWVLVGRDVEERRGRRASIPHISFRTGVF